MKSDNSDPIMFKQYLDEVKNLAPSTINVYYKSLERFLKNDPEIDDLNAYNEFLTKYSEKRRCYHYYSTLKLYINWKLTDINTKKRIIETMFKPKLQDPETDRVHLKEKKLLEVINNLKEKKHRVIALLQMFTGARAGDILRMKRGSIISENDEKLVILRLNIIGKRKKLQPKVIYDEVMQQVILDYILVKFGYEDYYFLNVSKHRCERDENSLLQMNYQWYWADLKQALGMSGVNPKMFATHDFRRCFSREIWNKFDKDISVLQKVLDHNDPKTTMRYLRISGIGTKEIYKKMQGYK